MRPRIELAGVLDSNTLNAPGYALKPATGSPIAKSLVPAVRLMFCACVLVSPGATRVVGFQRAPFQRSTMKFPGVAPASYSVAPFGNLKMALTSVVRVRVVLVIAQ